MVQTSHTRLPDSLPHRTANAAAVLITGQALSRAKEGLRFMMGCPELLQMAGSDAFVAYRDQSLIFTCDALATTRGVRWRHSTGRGDFNGVSQVAIIYRDKGAHNPGCILCRCDQGRAQVLRRVGNLQLSLTAP